MRRDPEFFQRRPSHPTSGHPTSGQSGAGSELDLSHPGELQADEQIGDESGEVELPLLYLSKRLREALKLEELLTANRIDYLVEARPYSGGLIFRRELTGAYFYVAEADLARCRELLLANGYKPFNQS